VVAFVNPDEYERLYSVEERHWWYAGMRQVAAAFGAIPLGRRLDAGCGTGFELARSGGIGVDISLEAVAACRRRGVTVARADISALPFADGSFDVVTCFDVLYHRQVRDDAAAVRELARVLAPGGALILRVAALPILHRSHDDAVHGARRYRRGQLRALLENAGLTVERISYANTLLLPLIAGRALADRVGFASGSELEAPPPPLEALLSLCLAIEARWLRRHDLPIGASLLALAQRRK
jgi:SAM-dependent methyltransferase